MDLGDVGAHLLALSGVEEGTRWGRRTWGVGTRSVAWERPLSKADVRRLGDAPVPDGELLAVSTADLSDKQAVLSAGHAGVLDLEHFTGHPAVLVQLDVVDRAVLVQLLQEAWEAAGGPAHVQPEP